MNRAVQLPEPFIYLRKTSFGHSKPKHTEELPVGTNYPQGIWFANFVNYQNTHVKVSWLDSFLKWEDQSTNQPKAASKLRMQWVPILQFHVHLAVLVQDEQPCGLPGCLSIRTWAVFFGAFCVQLTLEHCDFEPCGSTYTWIFIYQ